MQSLSGKRKSEDVDTETSRLRRRVGNITTEGFQPIQSVQEKTLDTFSITQPVILSPDQIPKLTPRENNLDTDTDSDTNTKVQALSRQIIIGIDKYDKIQTKIEELERARDVIQRKLSAHYKKHSDTQLDLKTRSDELCGVIGNEIFDTSRDVLSVFRII